MVSGNCATCHGSGVNPAGDECACQKTFKILAALNQGEFPEDHLLRLIQKTLHSSYTILSGQENIVKATTQPHHFLELGLSIVFYHSPKASLAASHTVYMMLESDYTIKCRYFDGDRELVGDDYTSELLVLDHLEHADRPKIEKILIQREKKVLSTMVCLNELSLFNDWINLAESLGWYGDNFGGEVYRGVEVRYKFGKSRWEE